MCYFVIIIVVLNNEEELGTTSFMQDSIVDQSFCNESIATSTATEQNRSSDHLDQSTSTCKYIIKIYLKKK